MPALVAFGRKWKLGSDDFIFTALVDTVIKAFWLISTAVVYIVNEPWFYSCQNEVYFNAYFCSLILSILLAFIIDFAIVINSGKGAIMDENARRWVTPLIYLRLTWELIDIGFNIVGTLWTFGEKFECLLEALPYTYSFVRRYVICNWISVGVIILLLKIFYDPFGRVNSTKSWEVKQCTNKYDVPVSRVSIDWERKLRLYLCFWGRSKGTTTSYEDDVIAEGFQEVGRLLAHLFHDTEFLTTDIVAGLIALCAKEQRLRHQLKCVETGISSGYELKETESVKLPAGENFAKVESTSPASEVHLLRHYCKYACGVSGWKGLFLDKFKHNPIRLLWRNTICCGCIRKPYNVDIEDDNCCFCNTSALRHWLPNIREEDLIYVSFRCDYYEVPFLIALDHSTKAIVIALRGSYSMKDILADYSGVPTPFTIEDKETVQTFLAHHGMLLVAQNVKKKLDRMKILSRLKDEHPAYKIVLVGNSLGGASASILGMLLHAQYNDLRVFNFNSPGGVMSLEAAKWCEPFTTTVSFGDDMIARTSIASMVDLKHRVHDAIRDCSTPKYKIIVSGLSSWCCGKMDSTLAFYSDNIDIDKTQTNKNTNIRMQFHAGFGSIQKQPDAGTIKASSFSHLMYMPGRIIHIKANSRWKGSGGYSSSEKCEDSPRFQMRWADRNEFLKIIVSPKMGRDHSHCKMVKAFDEYLEQNTRL